MGKVKDFDLEKPAPAVDDEDEQTLAAIDEGIRDAEAGRTVPVEVARKLLTKSYTAIYSQNVDSSNAGDLLLSAYSQLPIPHSQHPITPPTAYCLLPTAHFLLPTAYCLLLFSISALWDQSPSTIGRYRRSC